MLGLLGSICSRRRSAGRSGFAKPQRFGRYRPSRSTSYRRIRFEALEGRYCLSAPTITGFQVDSFQGTTVSVSGYLTDESPQTAVVDFDGALWGSTTPDASGYFSHTGQAVSLGGIVAVAMDEEGLFSNHAFVEIDSDVPVITSLSTTYGYHTEVTITGQVIDEDPGGLEVRFQGAVDGTTYTDPAGYFTLHVPSGYATLGDVDIYVADIWDQETVTSMEITGDDPPEFVEYEVDVTGGGLLIIPGNGPGRRRGRPAGDLLFPRQPVHRDDRLGRVFHLDPPTGGGRRGFRLFLDPRLVGVGVRYG